MKFTVNAPGATRQRTACAIVGIYLDGILSDTAQALDKASGGLLSDVTRNRDIRGETGETLLLTHTGKLPCKRILLVGLGKSGKLEQRGYRKAVRAAYSALGKAGHADLDQLSRPRTRQRCRRLPQGTHRSRALA